MRTAIAFLQLVLWMAHGKPALPNRADSGGGRHAVHATQKKARRHREPRSWPTWVPPSTAAPVQAAVPSGQADLYVPRFDTGNPGDSLEFDLQPSGSVLRVGRWRDAGFASDPGAVSRVTFYEAPAETVAVHDWSEVTWRPIGDGKFNELTGRWELPFATPTGDPYKAHVFVAQFHDLTAGADAGQLFTRAFGVNPSGTLSDTPVATPLTVRLWPSPARAGATITIELTTESGRMEGIDVGIYDVTGRRVAQVGRALATTGSRRVTWDGRFADGRIAPPAVYFVIAGRPGERNSIQRQVAIIP